LAHVDDTMPRQNEQRSYVLRSRGEHLSSTDPGTYLSPTVHITLLIHLHRRVI